MAATKNITPDAFVEALTNDACDIANTRALFGYIGEGTQEDTIKIYFDPNLSSHLEVKKDDILHHIKLTKTQSPLGGSYVWIDKATEYLYGTPYTSQKDVLEAQQQFQGDIYQRYVNECCTQNNDTTKTPEEPTQENPSDSKK